MQRNFILYKFVCFWLLCMYFGKVKGTHISWKRMLARSKALDGSERSIMVSIDFFFFFGGFFFFVKWMSL